MDTLFTRKLHSNSLIWLPEEGWGFCSLSNGQVYDKAYFDNYVELEDTPIGRQLNQARVDMVLHHTDGEVLDIGVGAGSFIKRREAKTFGYDINPAGIAWLKKRGLFVDPYQRVRFSIHAMTFWDSLEHIEDPASLLDRIKCYAFVSMPIYRDSIHLLESKHFKKGEHCLYFTREGLISWMDGHGFACLEYNTCEVECGREDIGSFVFRRTA